MLVNHQVLKILKIPIIKLNKALYGLKQAPRAWCDRLINFVLEKGF